MGSMIAIGHRIPFEIQCIRGLKTMKSDEISNMLRLDPQRIHGSCPMEAEVKSSSEPEEDPHRSMAFLVVKDGQYDICKPF